MRITCMHAQKFCPRNCIIAFNSLHVDRLDNNTRSVNNLALFCRVERFPSSSCSTDDKQSFNFQRGKWKTGFGSEAIQHFDDTVVCLCENSITKLFGI